MKMHSTLVRPVLWFWFLLGALWSSTQVASCDFMEYSSGHADIRTEFTGGRIELKWGLDVGAVLNGTRLDSSLQLNPSDVYARVSDDAKFTTSSSIDFLGNTAGADIWILPFNNDPDLPFLGTNSESLANLNPPFTSNSLQLVGFNGPGNFALWQTGPFGDPRVLFRTNDGLRNPDIINPVIGSHAHYNWGFTAEGVYDLTILATANRGSNAFTTEGTFRFVVGSATAVPEPSSLAMLSLAGVSVSFLIKRRPFFARRTDQA